MHQDGQDDRLHVAHSAVLVARFQEEQCSYDIIDYIVIMHIRGLAGQFVKNSVGRKICRNMRRFIPPPFDRVRPIMSDWRPKLKSYPHFDRHLSEDKILKIVTNPQIVAQNKFYPFMLFHESSMKFGGRKQERDKAKARPRGKPRPIRYAARRDSYIFAYYRHLLSLRYEEKLKDLGLRECVIAYRKIPVKPGGDSGKCNIHFARDAFAEIGKRGDCIAVALDISDFFGNINHERLETLWHNLIGFNELSEDDKAAHKAVFKAITKYADVDYYKVMKRLGYWGTVKVKGVEKQGYLCERKKIPMQLCSSKDFREKICGDDPKYTKLIEKDKTRTCGIPQGSPMSDLLANLYLLDFDLAISRYASKTGSYYRRYSDDILIICPKDHAILRDLVSKVKEEIGKAGEELLIKDEKTIIKQFDCNDGVLSCTFYDHPDFPAQAERPVRNRHFEYLGFSFDGKIVKLKDSTVSRYYRKMVLGIRSEARVLADRYSDKKPDALLKEAKVSKIYQKYGKIDSFEKYVTEPEKWNFWTYAQRAAKIMQDFDNRILSQVSSHKKRIMSLLASEIDQAYTKRSIKKAA